MDIDMILYRKTFQDDSYVEDEDANMLPEGGVLSEIDITDRIKSIADSEVSNLRIETKNNISEYMDEWVERSVIRKEDIPENIMAHYWEMINEYHVKKADIYTKYNINP